MTCTNLLILTQTFGYPHVYCSEIVFRWQYGKAPPDNVILNRLNIQEFTFLFFSLPHWAVGQTTGSRAVWINPMEVAS